MYRGGWRRIGGEGCGAFCFLTTAKKKQTVFSGRAGLVCIIIVEGVRKGSGSVRFLLDGACAIELHPPEMCFVEHARVVAVV